MKVHRSEKIEVRSDSFGGKGVFATHPIQEGELVAIKTGHLVRGNEVEELAAKVGDYALQIDDDFYLSPREPSEVNDLAIFINHSCDPNVGFEGQVRYVAMRSIKAGEELCHDYAMERTDNYSLSCKCGTSYCRKRITGADWKLPVLQQRYGKRFSAYINKKIEDAERK